MAYSPAQAIPEHYRRKFSNQWDVVTQQMVSKFTAAGMVDGDWTTKEKVFQDLSTVAFTENNARFGSTNASEVTGGMRKGSKRKFESFLKFDRSDDEFLDSLGAPQSEAIESMRYAWARKYDDAFIEAASATVYGGVDPFVTPISFPSGQIIAANYGKPGATTAGTTLGLTPWKIMEARRLLLVGDVDLDMEDPVLAIGPDEEAQLFLHIEASPNETWSQVVLPALNDRSKRAFGFRFVTTNRISADSNGIRQCIAYTRRAFTMSAPTFQIEIDKLPTQRHATQIAAYAELGILRRYDERVVLINADTTPV